jgi:hypothetical protein
MLGKFLKSSLIAILMLGYVNGNAQVEVLRITVKDFKGFGFGGFLNFSIPISEETNYLTLEAGYQYLKKAEDEYAAFIPVLMGFRYTLDRSGAGFFAEPFGGYSFGEASIYKYEGDFPVYDDEGNQVREKVSGPIAGLGFGYLFQTESDNTYTLALRYARTFSEAHTNTIALRFSYKLF